MQHIGIGIQRAAPWEIDVYTHFCTKQAEVFKDQSVKEKNDSATGRAINTYVLDLLKQCPLKQSSEGNSFVCCESEVCPTLKVRLSEMEPYTDDAPGIPNIIGVRTAVGPLLEPTFGDFTKQDIELVLTHLEIPPDAELTPNPWTKKRALEESLTTSIGEERTIGEVNTNPRLKTIEVVADVTIDGHFYPHLKLIGERLDRETLDLLIPIPHLTRHGKINYNGSVTLDENGKTFSLDEIARIKNQVWLGVLHRITSLFDIRDSV